MWTTSFCTDVIVLVFVFVNGVVPGRLAVVVVPLRRVGEHRLGRCASSSIISLRRGRGRPRALLHGQRQRAPLPPFLLPFPPLPLGVPHQVDPAAVPVVVAPDAEEQARAVPRRPEDLVRAPPGSLDEAKSHLPAVGLVRVPLLSGALDLEALGPPGVGGEGVHDRPYRVLDRGVVRRPGVLPPVVAPPSPASSSAAAAPSSSSASHGPSVAVRGGKGDDQREVNPHQAGRDRSSAAACQGREKKSTAGHKEHDSGIVIG